MAVANVFLEAATVDVKDVVDAMNDETSTSQTLAYQLLWLLVQLSCVPVKLKKPLMMLRMLEEKKVLKQ